MTASEVINEINTLAFRDRAKVVEETLRNLPPEERRSIERLLRRLQHPDVPETFLQGVEDQEDDRTVDMETALHKNGG